MSIEKPKYIEDIFNSKISDVLEKYPTLKHELLDISTRLKETVSTMLLDGYFTEEEMKYVNGMVDASGGRDNHHTVMVLELIAKKLLYGKKNTNGIDFMKDE